MEHIVELVMTEELILHVELLNFVGEEPSFQFRQTNIVPRFKSTCSISKNFAVQFLE